MRSNYLKATMKTAVLAVSILLLGVSVALAQTTVSLTAMPQHATLPDGQSVPMWGLRCTAGPCTSLHYGATGYDAQDANTDVWQPPLIIVPTGNGLTINLTNALPGGVPTSLVIVGQLGGGLGTTPTTVASPNHPVQNLTWPVGSSDATNTPPAQDPRVQSFAMEVTNTPKALSWTAANLRPGTYLIESGTHPSIQGPMGLYGILVVTTAPVDNTTPGTAYPPQPAAGGVPAIPAVSYGADLPLLLSEIDPVQNRSVDTAVHTASFSETKVWSGQKGECGDPNAGAGVANTCYPPTVNYAPRYYLINGVGFNKSSALTAASSLFSAAPRTATGNILVRLVNAGLRMHVPSIVGSLTGSPAVSGFGLIAEDGNPLPGVTRVQSEVFMAAGKTYDVMINAPVPAGTALPIFDRSLGLSANATTRDAGMLAYIGENPALPTTGAFSFTALAAADTYNSLISGQTLTVSDPAKGLLGNDVNVSGAKVIGAVPAGLVLNTDGTFTYTGGAATFTYCGNGVTAAPNAACALVTLGAAPNEAVGDITVRPDSYTARLATRLEIKEPGVLANDSDTNGYPLSVVAPLASVQSGLTITMNPNGSFSATATAPGTYTFTYLAKSSRGTVSTAPPTPATGTVTLTFPQPSNLVVNLIDGSTKQPYEGSNDYRWIIEEDRTFYIDPRCQTNPAPAGCPTTPTGTAPTFGVNFHSSYMPVVAQGCTGPISCESGQTFLNPSTGTHDNAVCDMGNGVCRAGAAKTAVLPGEVALDPTKRYYISVLPGDAVGVNGLGQDTPGSHQMGGAQIAAGQTSVNVLVEQQGQQPSKLSVFVFRDDHPLNGEHDAGGGLDVLSPNEPGLGGFNITIFDDVGGTGDAAGQMTYDEFGQPLSNSLAGTIDPVTGTDACPIAANPRTGFDGTPSDNGITGVIPVCPNYEADGTTLSPLAGQAVVVNVPPGRYGIVATPGADRIVMGEEWLQTNTLDGGKAHDAFLKIGEPSYFQEFGPAGYHVAIGFANPAFINAVGRDLCTGTGALQCNRTVSGKVTGVHMSRPSDERLYGSGSRDTFGYSQCYASLGSVDGADFTFSKCNDDGTFTLTGVPSGDWRLTIFDQWNDQIVDGISTPVRVGAGNVDLKEIAVHAWKQNLYTRTCFDVGNGTPGSAGYADGICEDNEQGLALVPTNVRFRDGSISNLNSTDLEGFAGFNEVFPLFNWYLLETDSTRYKNTGTHVINDAGGPADGSAFCGTASNGFPLCGSTDPNSAYAHMARTREDFSLPAALRFPGSVYCDSADCAGRSIADGPDNSPHTSTGRIDPGWVTSYGWQGFAGQNQFVEFGKVPFQAGENGGIRGHVVYTSTRPFDDPALLLQLTWEPMVPHVTINLYQVGTAPDGSRSLTMVDTTATSSWDDWAQGFWPGTNKPYMSCPGQDPADTFFFTLAGQPNYLNQGTAIPNNSQYKCYDGLHNWVQLQPAPYDGMYQFPSIAGRNATTGVPTGGTGAVAGTNCTICTLNQVDHVTPMLPAGRYVVEMIVPPGYELVKEEDKNILLGDAYEGPVTSQFAGFGNIFIMPDQASVAAAYNPNNQLIPSTNEGVTPRHEGDTGSVETFWPCVGEKRIVPDFMSLFPGSGQNAPFAGAMRNLCDRKEVILEDQMSVLAKFYVFSSTHVAGHFTGVISDDFTSEFDPFSPHFGEKFSPANLPVSVKDFAGNEISRVYSDWWGTYNGLNYSTFSVNPPDPSGYIPTMMVMCMNDRGTATAYDPFYQAAYSQFCYELPFMPGQTGYFDTPVIPTTAFAEGYNHPDCAYPDATPAISEVDGDGIGPWIGAGGTGHPITIHALGDQTVNNYGYTGPSVATPPYNNKTVVRHYGFGDTQGSGTVTIGGVTATVSSWSDSTIVVTVPASGNSQVPTCPNPQQQAQFGGSSARCGELVITAGNGKKSIDAITVTVGGKAPTHVAVTESIQTAIDNASPGDLIIVDPTCMTAQGNAASCTTAGATHSSSTHSELLIMWKPVRLQGVGAASTIINADAHPSGKLIPWRKQVVCLFGLGENGRAESWDPSCGAGWNFFRATASNPQVDRLPLEATVGWDATLNGNLAEQLQEPSLMGAYEGAGITVLSKGVRFPNGSQPFAADTFPDGTVLLTNSPNSNNCGSNNGAGNRFPSSFQCNPSRIDGLTVANSSQGGGGIFVHGWAHNLEISNNRVTNNQGTLAGGIAVGQGEHPDAYLAGADNAAPGSCQNSNVTNTQLPYCFDVNVNIHNNAVTTNSSEGDELFSASPSGAGGVAFCTGADSYKFNNNWVCGNLSTGDGAGISQLGFVWDGSIQHNAILFNQSTNPTTPTNGGGLLIMSAPDTDPNCPGEADVDCNLLNGSVSDGIGRNLVINANLIMGNAAEAGAGGGMRLQGVNGIEVSTFPTRPDRWYAVNVTNNIITNNVAGWDGAGVSLQDSIVVNLVNNTIVDNDSTAASGVLFNSFFADQTSAPTPCPQGTRCVPVTRPQPAGVSSAKHSAEFLASLPGTITCPAGHTGQADNSNHNNSACRTVSFPTLYNDVIWHNRAFSIDVVTPATGAQQSSITVVPTLNQTATGQCVTSTNYWDIGFRGDTAVGNHSSGFTYVPRASFLSDAALYPGGGNGGSSQFRQNSANPSLVQPYCNGSRVPPELGSAGYITLPGTNETNVPVPVFNLTAAATVDEGNNWVNINWGPLSLTHPVTGTVLGNYALAGGTAVNYITPSNSSVTYGAAPSDDYFGNPRKNNNAVDVGAVEFAASANPVLAVTPTSLAFNAVVGTTSAAQTLTLTNNGGAQATGITVGVTAPFTRSGGSCGATLNAGANCSINVVFTPTSTSPVNGTVTITASVLVTGSPVALSGTGVAAVVSATLTPTNWTPTAPRGVGGGIIPCLPIIGVGGGPCQAFTLTNTGNVPLTTIGQGALGGTSAADYSIIRLASTCGPAGNGQLSGQTTLNPGATCVVTVQFRPRAAPQPTGLKPATVSVTDAAGTQTSTLNGTAN